MSENQGGTINGIGSVNPLAAGMGISENSAPMPPQAQELEAQLLQEHAQKAQNTIDQLLKYSEMGMSFADLQLGSYYGSCGDFARAEFYYEHAIKNNEPDGYAGLYEILKEQYNFNGTYGDKALNLLLEGAAKDSVRCMQALATDKELPLSNRRLEVYVQLCRYIARTNDSFIKYDAKALCEIIMKDEYEQRFLAQDNRNQVNYPKEVETLRQMLNNPDIPAEGRDMIEGWIKQYATVEQTKRKRESHNTKTVLLSLALTLIFVILTKKWFEIPEEEEYIKVLFNLLLHMAPFGVLQGVITAFFASGFKIGAGIRYGPLCALGLLLCGGLLFLIFGFFVYFYTVDGWIYACCALYYGVVGLYTLALTIPSDPEPSASKPAK